MGVGHPFGDRQKRRRLGSHGSGWNYGIKITFDDGHDSGIFTWRHLRVFAEQRDSLWQAYLDRLEREGGQREASGVKLFSVKSDD